MIRSFREQVLINRAIQSGNNLLRGSIDTGYVYYDEEDIKMTKVLWPINNPYIPELNNRKLTIKNVIFNDPATIVFWTDGSKTVVKATNEAFDKEKGLAMAITKKFFGNQGNYYNQVKKWL
jgi:hypothetical protein